MLMLECTSYCVNAQPKGRQGDGEGGQHSSKPSAERRKEDVELLKLTSASLILPSRPNLMLSVRESPSVRSYSMIISVGGEPRA
jgi:hypothetical protein